MLDHLPRALGKALEGVRPGTDALVCARPEFARLPDSMELGLKGLIGAGLPPRCTKDGAGISPALHWSGVPDEAAELVLIVEDADPPMPKPFVHLIAYALPPQDGSAAEGDFSKPISRAVGKNSYLQPGWLPPDPPTGHGAHRYVFQLYALSSLSMLSGQPGRKDVIAAMKDKTVARGLLLATYERA